MPMTSSTPPRPRLAVWAYACNPTLGSDPGATWGYVRALSEHADIVLFHSPEDQSGLERWKAEHPGAPIQLRLVDEPRWSQVLQPGYRLHRQLRFVVYTAWLQRAYRQTRACQSTEHFDAVAHASYGNYWLPSPVRKLGLPSLWGPLGGGVWTPFRLWPTLGVVGVVAELERLVGLTVAALLPATRRTQRETTVAIVETEETLRRLPRSRRGDAVIVNRAAIIDEAPEAGPSGETVASEPYEYLFTSALWGKKGPRLAVEALKYTDPRVRLTFVNDGYERRRLERRARRLRVADRVRFLGRVPREELFARMRTATGLVFTGLREEGGVALAESMQQGLPVVVLGHGGAGLIARGAVDPRRVQIVAPSTPRRTAQRLGEAMTRLQDAPPDRTPNLDRISHLQEVRRALDLARPRSAGS